jgi:hypothetical protein
MANSSYVQVSFLGGEWSEAAQGRMDRPEYRTALAIARNYIPLAPGAMVRRPGFEDIAATRNGAIGKLFPFTFEHRTPYTIEMTEGFMRFHNGSTPVRTNDDQVITAISAANPAEITTTSAHGWSDDDRVRFLDLGINNPLLHNREFAIVSTGSTTFTITDALTGDAIDGSTLGTFVSGSVGRIEEVTTPYSESQLPALRRVQINDGLEAGLVVLSPVVEPQIARVENDVEGDDFVRFSFAAANLEDGPYLDPFPDSLVTPSGLNGVVALEFSFTAYASTKAYSTGDYVTDSAVHYRSLTDGNQGNTPASSATYWVAVDATEVINDGDGFQSGDLGRHVRIYSEPPQWVAGTTYSLGGVVMYENVPYTALQNSNTGKTPDAFPTWWSITPSATLWTWGKVTSISGSSSTLIPQATGSAFGNMTSGGGLSKAFDGDTSASLGIEQATRFATTAYIGKNYSGSPKSVGSVKVYGSSDVGIEDAGSQTTVNLRASQTLPASRSDGTLLGTSGEVGDPGGVVVTVTSTDQVTEWNYIWAELITNQASSITIAVAEVEFYSIAEDGGTGCSIQIMGDALLYTTATRTWRLGLYSDTSGWPHCGVGHEGRLFLAGAADNRFDASRSNKPFNFAPTEKDGTVVGSNAFTYTFNAKEANSIFWMQSEKQGVLCGTSGGEWLVQATSNSNPLTPTTVQAHRGTIVKCADIDPADCDNSLAFIQAGKRRLIEYFADVNAGKFTAPDLAEDAKHLTTGRLAEVVYQAPILWLRDEDGELRGVTYKRESTISSQPAEHKAWHQHDLGSGHAVESMSVGPAVDGEDPKETLTVITVGSDDIRRVQILRALPEENETLLDAAYLDNSITPSAYVVDSVEQTVTMYGLWPLNDQEVTVWAGGLDLGDFTVEDGAVVVSIGAHASFTMPYVMSFGGAMPIVVGFSYLSQGQLLRPATSAETGAQMGPGFGKLRRVHNYAVQLLNAKGISFGTVFDKLHPAKLTTRGGTALTAFQMKTGVHTDVLEDGSTLDGMICWQISRPYPATIVAIGGFIQTADK